MMNSTRRLQASLLRLAGSAAAALAFMLAPAVFASQSAQAQSYHLLYSFTGAADGARPAGQLVMDASGNLYGTTKYGGDPNCSFYVNGCGTVFKLDANGTETVLHSFAGGADGETPFAGLVLDTAGNLYGTTSFGGAFNLGTVFKLDTSSTKTVLYDFTGGADGGVPDAGLIRDTAGNLYGTTVAGGAFNSGTVFALDTAGTQTVLYSFTGGADGAAPLAGLVLDGVGNLYGTTSEGGSQNDCLGVPGCGVVFELDPSGAETVLYSFTGGADGGVPRAGLVLDAAGNLFGTATAGGDPAGDGVVFKVDASGTQTVLHSFTGGTDGAGPYGGLVLDAASNLYGTTSGGGAQGFGTVFELDTTGKETVAYSFAGGMGGASPLSGLLLDAAGNLFGTTDGTASTFGTVFEINPDFSLAVSALSPSTVSPGGSSTATVNITAISAFSGSVALSCSVQPLSGNAPRCSISPGSITVGVPATLTVTTTAARAGILAPRSAAGRFYALWLPLIGVVAGVGFGSKRERKGKIPTLVLACLLFAGLVFGIACGGGGASSGGGNGGGSGGTSAGTYTITVTGMSGSSQHSAITALTVQ